MAELHKEESAPGPANAVARPQVRPATIAAVRTMTYKMPPEEYSVVWHNGSALAVHHPSAECSWGDTEQDAVDKLAAIIDGLYQKYYEEAELEWRKEMNRELYLNGGRCSHCGRIGGMSLAYPCAQ